MCGARNGNFEYNDIVMKDDGDRAGFMMIALCAGGWIEVQNKVVSKT
jgi:hypothetical protein